MCVDFRSEVVTIWECRTTGIGEVGYGFSESLKESAMIRVGG